MRRASTKTHKCTGTQTQRRPACAQVIVRHHYLTHLQQENNRYSICTKQISKAVQFIRANYWYKVLEVISTRHILHSFRHRPSALLWIKVLPAWLHNGLIEQQETGWSNYLTVPSQGLPCTVSPVMFLKDADFRSVCLKWNPHSMWSVKLILIRDQRQETQS